MEFDAELSIGDEAGLLNLDLGKTVFMGSWLITKVIGGWIYTLKTSSAVMGHAVADYRSLFVPECK